MRSWIAAVRLGRGLANKKIGTTRFNTSLAAAAAAAAEENGKSIYLCFNERVIKCECGGRYKNQVVRRIGLNTSSSTGDNAELLLVTANKVSESEDSYPTRFTTLGCNIVFPLKERRHVCWLDTSKPTPKIRISSPINPKFRSFDQPKHRVHMGEVDGRLYSIGVDPHSEPDVFETDPDFVFDYSYSIGTDPMCKLFEVFDHQCLCWRPLPGPPFVFGRYELHMDSYRLKSKDKFFPTPMYRIFHNYDTRFLDESKKILGWVTGEPRVFCFDVTNPGNKWTQLDNQCLLNTIPFAPNHLFIHMHHPHIGDFYLIFTYKPEDEPLCVYPYFMSNTFDSFRPIYHPIHLPELCIRYIQSEYEIDRTEMVYSFQFLQLGGQKVGLVINTFGQGIGYVLLVTFEYEIIVGVEESEPNIQIQTRLLGTRHFVYHPMDLHFFYNMSPVRYVLFICFFMHPVFSLHFGKNLFINLFSLAKNSQAPGKQMNIFLCLSLLILSLA